MTILRCLTICTLCACTVSAADFKQDTTVKTPHGLLFVRSTHFSKGDADHPCEFSGSVVDGSRVGWRNLDLSVKLSGMSLKDWGTTISLDIPVRIDVIAGNWMLGAEQIGESAVEFTIKCDGSGSRLEPSQMTARFLNGTPNKHDVDVEASELQKTKDALAPYYSENAKLPILNTGSSVAFLAADRKCAEEFQLADSMEGLEKRKRIAELVDYKCGSVIDVPVRLTRLSVEAIESIKQGGLYLKVTVADCWSLENCPAGNKESKGKSGWVPAKWLTNY